MSVYFNETAEKEKAAGKLRKEHDECKAGFNKYAKVMAADVLKALISFVEQDVEFAEAVNQNSQTFGNCMETVSKGIGSSISDFDAFKKAVQFYFPGAEIEYQMRIKVNPFEKETKEASEGVKTLSLLDILG